MLQLSRSAIQDLVGFDVGATAAIKDAYVAVTDGRADVPPVGHLDFAARNGECHIKYGYITGDPIFVVKIASGFYDNPAKGLPSSNGMIAALSAVTGQVIAVLSDEGWLTDLRTGIGGAVATFALCRPEAERFAIVGTGTQARFQIRAIAAMAGRPVRFSVWGRSDAAAEALRAELAATGLHAEVAADLEALCRASDVIVTTTPATEPLIRSDWISEGTHITAVGADSPGKHELETRLVARADVRALDMARQCLVHGEVAGAYAEGLIRAEDCVELGRVLAGRWPGRRAASDITIADLTGVATQDIAIARTVLERAPGVTL